MVINLAWILSALLLFALPAQSSPAERNQINIRHQVQDIYVFQGTNGRDPCRSVLFLPGDGGWRGFAIVIAQTISSMGYDVYAWDTKRYLEGFTGKVPLTEIEVMTDFRQVAEWIHQRCRQSITLVGWSEGAGLCLLAAASAENKSMFAGLVTLGLTEENALSWHWTDYLRNLVSEGYRGPSFRSIAYMSEVSPVPFWILQSTGDQYVSVEASNRLFAAAKEPKQYVLITANNHRFDGNQQELFRVIRRALEAIDRR